LVVINCSSAEKTFGGIEQTERTRLPVVVVKETGRYLQHTKKRLITMLIESIQLRSQRVDNLSDKDAKAMLQRHNFYCGDFKWSKEWCNPTGQGIKHHFELQQNTKSCRSCYRFKLATVRITKYMTYAYVEKYISNLNKNRFAGYDDWRLPTLEEAMSLMEREKKNGNLYIDLVFDRRQQHIWTADIGRTEWPWLVSFDYGCCTRHVSSSQNYVRAVRSGQSII
jgi:hypothetical protein